MAATRSRFAEATLRLGVDGARLEKGLKRSGRDIRRWSDRQRKSLSLVRNAFAGITAYAGGRQVVEAVRTWGTFEAALSNVQAKTSATAKEMKSLNKILRENAVRTRFTATQVGDAAGFLAQAGLNVGEIKEAIAPTLDLAAAANTAVDRTADILTNISQGMNIATKDLGRVADVLAKTTASSNTNLEELGGAFSIAVAAAENLKLSVEELSAGFGLLANRGIKSTRAGTAYRQALVALFGAMGRVSAETTELEINFTKQAETLRRLGVEIEDGNGGLRNLYDILRDLADAGATGVDIFTIFGARAGNAMQLLIRNLPELRGLTTTLQNAGGAAREMARIQMNNLIGDFQKLASAWENFSIEFVDVTGLGNSIRRIFQGVAKELNSFTSSLEESWKSVKPFLVQMRDGFTEVLVKVSRLAGTITNELNPGLKVTTDHTKALGLVLAEVVGIVTALYTILKGIGFAIAATVVLLFPLQVLFMGFWSSGVKAINLAILKLGGFWLVLEYGQEVFEFLRVASLALWKAIGWGLGKLFGPAGEWVKGFKWGYRYAKSIIEALAGFFKNFIDGAIGALQWLYTAMKTFIGEGPKGKGALPASHPFMQIRGTTGGDSKHIQFAPLTPPEAPAAAAPTAANADDLANLQKKAAETTAEIWTSTWDAIASGAKDAFGSILEIMERTSDSMRELNKKWTEKDSLNIAEMAELQKQSWISVGQSFSDFIGLMARNSKKAFAVQKGIAAVQATVDYASAMISLLKVPSPMREIQMNLITGIYGAQLAAIHSAQPPSGQAHAGMDYVPSDGSYVLQRGEAVIKKDQNKALRDFLSEGGGGPQVVVNIPVTSPDAQSFADMMTTRESRKMIQGALEDGLRNRAGKRYG